MESIRARRAASRSQIAVTHDEAVVYRDGQPLLAVEKEVGSRLGPQHIAALDHIAPSPTRVPLTA